MKNQGLRNSQIVFALGHQNDSHPPKKYAPRCRFASEFSQLTWAAQCVFKCLSTLSRNIYDPDCEKKIVIEDGGAREKSKWTLVSNLSFLSELLFTFTHSDSKG